MYYTAYGTELTTDIIIMFLPVPIIKNLHLDRGKKLRLIGIFWLGALFVPLPSLSEGLEEILSDEK